MSPSSNSTVIRSPSSSRPSKPGGRGGSGEAPGPAAPWRAPGKGGAETSRSAAQGREGGSSAEQNVGFRAPRAPQALAPRHVQTSGTRTCVHALPGPSPRSQRGRRGRTAKGGASRRGDGARVPEDGVRVERDCRILGSARPGAWKWGRPGRRDPVSTGEPRKGSGPESPLWNNKQLCRRGCWGPSAAQTGVTGQ